MSYKKSKFKDFVKYYDKEYYSLPLMNNPSGGAWNPKRQDYLKQHNSKRKTFLSELEEIEATSVSDLVPKDFFSQQKSKIIFSNFLKELSQETLSNKKQTLTIDSCPMIAEQKEEYEIIKRNLTKYIEYIMNKNFHLLKRSSKNLNSFYVKIEKSLLKIAVLKKRFGIIKNKYFLINSEIYLKKQKLKNCKNIYNNLLKLREYKKTYLYITNKKSMNYKLEQNNKSKFNKNVELVRNIEKFPYYNKSLICFWFIQHLRINKNDYIDNYGELLSKLFLTKISVDEFNSLYDIFSNINNNIDNNIMNKNNKNTGDELINKLVICYKKNILNVFKGILLSYATIDYSESQNSNQILKLKQLQMLSFEEEKLFLAINQICLTIMTLCDNLSIYFFTKDYRNTKFGNLLYNKRKIFYEILNKKLRKILFLYTDLILNFQVKKNVYLILSSFSLIYAYIEKTFQIYNAFSNNSNTVKKAPTNTNNNKKKMLTIKINNKNVAKNAQNNTNNKTNYKNTYSTNTNTISSTNSNINNTVNQISALKKEINNFFIQLTSFELKQDIKNLALYLNKDNWKKLNFLNLNEQINKKYIRVIKYRKFLTLPFSNINMDKSEIKKYLTELGNFKESKDIKLNISKLFNKKLNEKNLIFSSSSFNLLFYICEFISYSIIIPNLKKKIISDILSLYDYFIYASLLMFNYDKINIGKLQQKKIIKEYTNNKKNKNSNEVTFNELLAISRDMDYFEKYMNLIPYLWHCKKEVLIKILGDEKILFTILPSLSPTVLRNNNNTDDNNTNIGNFIEKIICYECYWSLFKIIKRITPTGKNYESNLIQINKYKIILNEIRHFFYYPLSTNLIKNKSYINNFINNNWLINTNNINKNKSNVYIQIIINNLKDINNKLNLFLPISLKAKIRFVYVVLEFMVDNIKESISQIRNINQQGLNIIINDFKILQNTLYEFINLKDNGSENNNKLTIVVFDDIFNNLYEFFNNIIANKNIFINNIGKNKIPLFLMKGLLNLNKSITVEDKKKIEVDLKCNCLKEMQIIDRTLMRYN